MGTVELDGLSREHLLHALGRRGRVLVRVAGLGVGQRRLGIGQRRLSVGQRPPSVGQLRLVGVAALSLGRELGLRQKR